MNYRFRSILVFAALWAVPGTLCAAPDQFLGDSAIYSTESTNIRPNVLFIIDNSAGMAQAGSGEPYKKDNDYSENYTDGPAPYAKDQVYVRTTATGGTINYNQYISDVNTEVSCPEAKTALLENGYYSGPLKKSTGSCDASQPGNYFTGNLLNYLSAPSTTPVWSANTPYVAGAKVQPSFPLHDSNGVPLEFEVLTAGTTGGSEPAWPTTVGSTVTDGTVVFGLSGTIIDMVQETVKQVMAGASKKVNFGVMVFGDNNHGGRVLSPVAYAGPVDPEDPTTVDGPTSFSALETAIDNIALLNANAQPVNETFWDASLYFAGKNDSSSKLASEKTPYPSPITLSCQENMVILLTTGSTDDNSQTKLKYGDLNSDGNLGYIDDAAKLLYQTDHRPSMPATIDGQEQVIKTHVIQLLTPEVVRLKNSTDNEHGHGSYNKVNNTSELTAALLAMMVNLMSSEDTAFVSPTIPASPENRSYSGSRIYLGFFKPVSKRPWLGNLKKFGINASNQIVDKSGSAATETDGSFKTTAQSYWNDIGDGGTVNKGGVGDVLLARIKAGTARKLYSNLSTTSNDLTSADNAFNKANVAPELLGLVGTTERDQLVDFLHGFDVYDDNVAEFASGVREWPMADIRHSKPAVVNYRPYDLANEASCSENKTMIYVGANDGSLHAYSDCDGQEAWAFLPKKVLPNLKEMAVRPAQINYSVDASPIVMRYDANKDGTIDPASDKIVLIFGLRRGGNAYYALDVTNPAVPKLLWDFDADTSGFSDLGESWSDPQFAKVRIGSASKVLAFFGAGYDINEDGRYGTTGTFPAATTQEMGSGNVTSSGTTTPESRPNPVGRGVYAISVADLSASGAPSMTSPSVVWSYTASNNSKMQFSFPTDMSLVDSNADGYADKVYAGDTGGQLWRFDIKATDTASWTGDVIFNLPASSGRKFFYKPSVAVEGDISMIAIGSGDREHPLNRAVVDRMYMIKDKGQVSASGIDEGNLMDVTANELQGAGTTVARQEEILSSLNASTNYGWMVQLSSNPGEKVLASPLIINKVAYFTTYTPNILVAPDPCIPGNLGVSRLYALNYKTGEATLNFQANNDTSSVSNERALNKDGKVLLTADRVATLGSGIPSGLTIIIPESGDLAVVATSGGGVIPKDAEYKVRPQIINWRMW